MKYGSTDLHNTWPARFSFMHFGSSSIAESGSIFATFGSVHSCEASKKRPASALSDLASAPAR